MKSCTIHVEVHLLIDLLRVSDLRLYYYPECNRVFKSSWVFINSWLLFYFNYLELISYLKLFSHMEILQCLESFNDLHSSLIQIILNTQSFSWYILLFLLHRLFKQHRFPKQVDLFNDKTISEDSEHAI